MRNSTEPLLPLFESFNQLAADDEAYDRLWEEGGTLALPTDDVFMVSHSMVRDTPLHDHDYFELAYVFDGRVINRLDGQDLYLLADSLCLMCPGTSHALVALDHEAVIINLCLRPTLFTEGIFRAFLDEDTDVARAMRRVEGSGFLTFSDAYGRILRRSMLGLLKEYDHAGRRMGYSVVAHVLLLLSQLSEIETYSFYGIDRDTMEILDFIDAHPEESSVSSLAERFGYNKTYFSHMMRSRLGMRARELIVAARMRRSLELLSSTDMPMREIASSVGYKSYSHFNRVFIETYHITPAGYRAYAQQG